MRVRWGLGEDSAPEVVPADRAPGTDSRSARTGNAIVEHFDATHLTFRRTD